MRNAWWLSLLLLAALSAPANAVREAHSISFPAVSADGQTVYFSCWGDIWAAPRDGSAPARRLTDNVAFEARPMISPDGQWIAFLSDRFGNYDIFVMPAAGGEARRLTWYDGYDYPYDWKPDGSAVLAYTERQDLWGSCAYEIPLSGGAPRRLSGPDHDEHVFISYLGDAEHLVYSRGPADWAKKHYHGTRAYDLWSYDVVSGEHRQLTDYDGKDLWPQPSPDGSVVYFISDRSGSENLWALTLDSGQLEQLSSFGPEQTVRWPRISPDGDEVACEVFGELYIVSTQGMQQEKVQVWFADDLKHEPAQERDFRHNVGEYVLSPNGKYFALTVLGDVFLLKNPESYEEDASPDQDLSRTRLLVGSPGREMHLDWHPDSTKLSYVSDRHGQFDVFTLDLVTLEERRLTTTEVDEAYPLYAPQGEHLAYYSGNRQLMLYDLDTDEESLLYEGQLKHGPYYAGYSWAPDGYWLSFQEGMIEHRTDIFLINIEEREAINITRMPDWDGGAEWSTDGKYLAFATSGDESGDIMLLELDPEAEQYDLELLFPDDQPASEDEELDAATEAEPDNGDADEAAAEEDATGEETAAEEELEPLSIDFERIQLRAETLTAFRGEVNGPWLDPNSEFLVFVTNHSGEEELWSITLEDRELAQLGMLGDMENLQFAPDGSRLYFLENGRLNFMELAGAEASGGGNVPVVSRLDYNRYRIWEQLLSEGWRILKYSFYDDRVLGPEWQRALDRYLPRVRECGTVYEFGRLYREMLGELGASHVSYYGYGNEIEAPREHTADFGVLFDESYAGPGWQVARVIPDGPADQPGSRLYVGDVVLALNEHEIQAEDNRSLLLRNLADIPVRLVVQNGAEAEAALDEATGNGPEDDSAGEPEPPEREVVIKPVTLAAMRIPLYETWVEDNRAMIDELSDGRIGYQHIRRMYDPQTQRFRRELFSENIDKEALIIDVRFNSGGSSSIDVLNLLDEQPAYKRQLRDSDEWYYGRQLIWQGPIVVLVNAHSFSNAEIFSHIMKDLGLATIIGEDTGGGVISTYTIDLMDGSRMGVPAWGNYRLSGEDMEGGAVKPDIYVHIDPMAVAAGRDNQIETAVEHLFKQLASAE